MNTPFRIDPRLRRYPAQGHESWQAWDAADELILQYLNEYPSDLSGKRILILNDQFGALSCALAGRDITVYTDSYLSFRGIQLNNPDRALLIHRLEELSGNYDFALVRVPRNMSFFEDSLCCLSGHLHSGTRVICGYMVKHQANASFELLDRYIGPTRTSLARKKARLIFADVQRAPHPSFPPFEVNVPGLELPLVNRSNLFSRERLDIGTRFLMEHLPQGEFRTILDLGCGNGVIGIAAKKLNPRSRILFTDESWMAVESARSNYERFFQDQADFAWNHCLENQVPGKVDLVLCNPPFHQGTAVGDQIAWRMFKDAHHALAKGGMIRVIGNLHLGYRGALGKVFGNAQVIATNRKFEVLNATRCK